MKETRCAECDQLIFAYALAVNHQNEVASALQEANSADERQALSETLTCASRDCQALRTRLAEHYLAEKTVKVAV